MVQSKEAKFQREETIAQQGFEAGRLEAERYFSRIIGVMVAKEGGELFISIDELLVKHTLEQIDEVGGIRFKARKDYA